MEPSSGAQATAVPPPPLSAVPPPPAADAPGATGRVGLGELRGGEGFSLGMGSFMNHLLAMDAATVTPSAMLRQLEPSLMLTAAQVDQLDGAALPLPVMHDSVGGLDSLLLSMPADRLLVDGDHPSDVVALPQLAPQPAHALGPPAAAPAGNPLQPPRIASFTSSDCSKEIGGQIDSVTPIPPPPIAGSSRSGSEATGNQLLEHALGQIADSLSAQKLVDDTGVSPALKEEQLVVVGGLGAPATAMAAAKATAGKRDRSVREEFTFLEYEKLFGPAARCQTGPCADHCITPCPDHTCKCCKKNRRMAAPTRGAGGAGRSKADRKPVYCGPCSKRQVVSGLSFMRCCYPVELENGDIVKCGAELLADSFENHFRQHRSTGPPMFEEMELDQGRRCSKCTNMRPISYYPAQDTSHPNSCNHCQENASKTARGAAPPSSPPAPHSAPHLKTTLPTNTNTKTAAAVTAAVTTTTPQPLLAPAAEPGTAVQSWPVTAFTNLTAPSCPAGPSRWEEDVLRPLTALATEQLLPTTATRGVAGLGANVLGAAQLNLAPPEFLAPHAAAIVTTVGNGGLPVVQPPASVLPPLVQQVVQHCPSIDSRAETTSMVAQLEASMHQASRAVQEAVALSAALLGRGQAAHSAVCAPMMRQRAQELRVVTTALHTVLAAYEDTGHLPPQ